jgi:DNA-binding protein HU-beta
MTFAPDPACERPGFRDCSPCLRWPLGDCAGFRGAGDPQRFTPAVPAMLAFLGRSDLLIKLDIVNEVVNRTGITKTKAEMAVETVFESMKRALSQGERIELRGFGIFNVRPRKTGIGRNPRTGDEVEIPPGKAVRFKPGKELQSLP